MFPQWEETKLCFDSDTAQWSIDLRTFISWNDYLKGIFGLQRWWLFAFEIFSPDVTRQQCYDRVSCSDLWRHARPYERVVLGSTIFNRCHTFMIVSSRNRVLHFHCPRTGVSTGQTRTAQIGRDLQKKICQRSEPPEPSSSSDGTFSGAGEVYNALDQPHLTRLVGDFHCFTRRPSNHNDAALKVEERRHVFLLLP